MKKAALLCCICLTGICACSFAAPVVYKQANCVLLMQDSTIDLEATIVQIIPGKKETVLVINKGSRAGVKDNDKGRIPGLEEYTVTITDVYLFRSKAIINATDQVIGGRRKVILKIIKNEN